MKILTLSGDCTMDNRVSFKLIHISNEYIEIVRAGFVILKHFYRSLFSVEVIILNRILNNS